MTNVIVFLLMIGGSVGLSGFIGHRQAARTKRWDEQHARLRRAGGRR